MQQTRFSAKIFFVFIVLLSACFGLPAKKLLQPFSAEIEGSIQQLSCLLRSLY